MTSEELSVLPDATLIAIARNCPKYEASESLRGLVMELSRRLEQEVRRNDDQFFNFLTRD